MPATNAAHSAVNDVSSGWIYFVHQDDYSWLWSKSNCGVSAKTMISKGKSSRKILGCVCQGRYATDFHIKCSAFFPLDGLCEFFSSPFASRFSRFICHPGWSVDTASPCEPQPPPPMCARLRWWSSLLEGVLLIIHTSTQGQMRRDLFIFSAFYLKELFKLVNQPSFRKLCVEDKGSSS